MPVDLDHFCQLRPFLYHLTATKNVKRILRVRRLESASLLYQQAGLTNRVVAKRAESDSITIDSDIVSIRDQGPLHAGNMTLEAGCSFVDFLGIFNARVFFWPGTDRGPIPSRFRRFARYQEGRPERLHRESTDNP